MTNKFLVALGIIFALSGGTAFASGSCSYTGSSEFSSTVDCVGYTVNDEILFYNSSGSLLDTSSFQCHGMFGCHFYVNSNYFAIDTSKTPGTCSKDTGDAINRCYSDDTDLHYISVNGDIWKLSTAYPGGYVEASSLPVGGGGSGGGFFADAETQLASLPVGFAGIIQGSLTSIWPVVLVVIGTALAFYVLVKIQDLIMYAVEEKKKKLK